MSDKDFVNQMCLLTACGASSRFNLRNLAGRVAFCLLVMAVHAPAVLAATINVDGDCSLANAIRSADGVAQTGAMSSCETGDSGADTINFTRDVSLTEALPAITTEVTLEGNNRTLRRASSAGDLRLLSIAATGNVTINSLTLRDGRLTGSEGGAAVIIAAGGELMINNSTVRDNHSVTWGGGILGDAFTMTVTNSEFFGNTSSGLENSSGGAIYAVGSSTVTISGSSFHSNTAIQGPAIDSHAGVQLTVEGSDFRNNVAEEAGGGAISSVTSLTIRASAFVGNRAGTEGGALFSLGTLRVYDSAFMFNEADRSGGAIITTGETTIENTTLFGNRLTNLKIAGTALVSSGNSVTLRHVTILNTRSGSSSVEAAQGATLNLVNSVIAGSAGDDCVVRADSNLGTNINNWIEDGTCSAAFSGDPMLSTPRGSPAFIPPYTGSGLVDAVPNDANCLASDQVGRARPVGDACDIGAYEGAISRPVKEEARSVKAPTPARSTCLSLPASIRVTGLSESTQCQQVSKGGIGAPALRDGFIDAVDVWSWILPGTEVCFRADSGRIYFIDTTVLPRTVAELPANRVDGFICAMINRAGQVVLMPGPPAPQRSAPNQADVSRGLSGCFVTTTHHLHLRHRPAGTIVGLAASGTTLFALARTNSWFHVNYYGRLVWISADYVRTAGRCD